MSRLQQKILSLMTSCNGDPFEWPFRQRHKLRRIAVLMDPHHQSVFETRTEHGVRLVKIRRGVVDRVRRDAYRRSVNFDRRSRRLARDRQASSARPRSQPCRDENQHRCTKKRLPGRLHHKPSGNQEQIVTVTAGHGGCQRGELRSFGVKGRKQRTWRALPAGLVGGNFGPRPTTVNIFPANRGTFCTRARCSAASGPSGLHRGRSSSLTARLAAGAL